MHVRNRKLLGEGLKNDHTANARRVRRRVVHVYRCKTFRKTYRSTGYGGWITRMRFYRYSESSSNVNYIFLLAVGGFSRSVL